MSLLDDAKSQLAEYQRHLKPLLRLKVQSDNFADEAYDHLPLLERLANYDLSVEPLLPTTVPSPAQQLLAGSFERKDRKSLIEAHRSLGDATREMIHLLHTRFRLTERIGESKYNLQLGKAWVEFSSNLASYNKVLSRFLDKISPAPDKFTWKGVRFENPDFWSERDVDKLLDELSWLFDIFKRRGVTDLLLENLTRVELVRGEKAFTDDRGTERSEAGNYWAREKRILLRHNAAVQKGGKMLRKWLAEIFLHELGHHVHLSELPREAKEFWDSGWAFVDDAEQDLKIGLSDRERFAALVKRHDWDFNAAGSTLKGLDRLLYLAWLNHHEFINGTKRVRLVQPIRDLVYRIQNPREWLMEAGGKSLTRGMSEEEIDELVQEYQDRALSVMDRRMGLRLQGDYPIPGPIAREIRENHSDVDKALDALGIPTEYGTTNVKEDFAETFVQWMVNPERLSDVARWRMGRTLGISEAKGKPMMRMTKKLSEAVAYRKWMASRIARRILANANRTETETSVEDVRKTQKD